MVAAHNNNTFQLIACSSSPYRFPWFATHFQPWDLSSRSFCMNLLGFCSYGVCVFCWLTVREFQRMEPNLASILNAAFKSVHTMSKMQWITSRDFSNETKSNPAPQGPNGNVPKFQPRMFARKKICRTQAFTRLNLRLGDGKWLEKGGYVCIFVIMCDWFEGFAAAFLRRKIRSQVRASPSRFLAAPCSAQRRASANKVQRATSGSSDGACRRSCLNIFLGHGASGICFFPFCSCRFYLEH